MQIARLVWQRIRLTCLLRRAKVANEQLLKLVEQAAEKLAFRRKLRVVLTDEPCDLHCVDRRLDCGFGCGRLSRSSCC